MSRERTIRTRDADAVVRLLGAVAQEPHLREKRSRLLDAIVELAHSRVAVMFRATIAAPATMLLKVIHSTGWIDANQRELFARDQRENLYCANPLLRAIAASLCTASQGDLCVHRRQRVNDVTWYGNDYVQSVYRSLDIDDLLVSIVKSDNTGWQGLALVRSWNDRERFRESEVKTVRLAHLGSRFLFDEPPEAENIKLSPRLREVLELLLLGESEKQIAMHLRISRFTVHRHVTRLYRLMGVTSHPELMARFCHPASSVYHVPPCIEPP